MTNHNQDRDHLSPEFTADTQTPHSGSEHVSEEMRDFHRTGEFDRSRLQDVANERTAGGEEILTVPDSPASNPDALKDLYDMPAVIPPKEHRDDKNTGKGKKIGLIAGGLAAGAGILGVGIVVGSASSESDTATPATVATPEAPVVSDNILDTPPSETVITVEAVPVETTLQTPETVPTDAEVQTVRNFGNIGLDTLDLGSDFITATRLDGGEIKVPRLNMTNIETNPNEFAASTLSLLACYITTGSQECLDALTPVPEIQTPLSSNRQANYDYVINNPDYANWQLAIFDTPDEPAEFTSKQDGSGYVVEFAPESGPVYTRMYSSEFDSNEWQNPDTRAEGAAEASTPLSEFSVRVEERNGVPVITRLNYRIG